MSLFSAFVTSIKGQLWPAGEAKTLQTAHTAALKAAMADIQKWVPQLQVLNTSTWARCDRFWEDAKSVVEWPNGIIKRIYTVVSGETGGTEWRDKVFYDSASFLDVERRAKRLIEQADTPPNTGLPALNYGFRYEESSVDSDIGRARNGLWAIYRRRLYVAPWLQSNELLVAEWDGVKTSYADADVIDDDLWENDVIEAIKYYVMWQHELYFGDPKLAANFMVLYNEKRADLMVIFNERTRQQPVQSIPEAVTSLTTDQIEDDDDAAEDADVECSPLPSNLEGME